MTEIKQLLREKSWCPSMNSIGQCYECQVTMKQHRQETVKVTDSPKKPWEVIAVDFGGPYPDGHYNLLAIDKRTRYPEVAKIHLTAARPTVEKLKTMFATHGMPRQFESENGLPIQLQRICRICQDRGISSSPCHTRTSTCHWRS